MDRLSALLDSLLIRILAFLQVKEASITSLLSKRWQFLWTQLPTLVFRDNSKETNKIRKFVSRVHRTLLICKRNNLERFEIEFCYQELFECDVKAWIEFAVRKKLKVFHLLLRSSRHFQPVPQMVYTASSLTSLYMLGSVLAPRRTIEWHSLTELRIEDTLLGQSVVDKILSGCPVLRGLWLSRCWGFNVLEIKSRSLQSLCVVDFEFSDHEPLLGISAPYLRCLVICLPPGGRKLRLGNVQSVVRADFDFGVFDWELSASSEMVMRGAAMEFFGKTQHVRELRIGSVLFEVMSMLVVDGWQLPQSRRECLKVTTVTSGEPNISGFLALLESSPSIHTLILQIHAPSKDSVTCDASARGDLDCDLLHLKTVKIRYYTKPNGCSDQLLTWVRILLKRAIVLEKMLIEIDLKDHIHMNDFIKITQALSSHKAEVVLC